MAKLELLSSEALSAELQALQAELARATSNPANEVVAAFGHCPEIIAGFLRFFLPLRSGGLLGSRLKELLRLRVVAAIGCAG